jgi:hypothetical protein
MAYDLAQARQHEADINVKPVARRKLHELHPSPISFARGRQVGAQAVSIRGLNAPRQPSENRLTLLQTLKR